MEQLICHLVGDYVLQSHWMATEKTKRSIAALIHVALYGSVFLLITRDPLVLAVIVGTHFVIDRFRLARHVSWVKNFLAPVRRTRVTRRPRVAIAAETLPWQEYEYGKWTSSNPSWADCSATGYPPDTPPWMSVWLMIIVDQAMHLSINYAALRWLA